MKLNLVMMNLPQNKKDLLEVDLKHFKEQIKDDVNEAYLKLKHNRGFLFKTANILNKFNKSGKIGMEFLRTALEAFTGIEIFKYNIQYIDNKTIVDFEVMDEYFLLMQQASGFLGKLAGNDKKGFIKMIEREAKKTYTDKFELKEVEDVISNNQSATGV
jgi:hypothetical protein